MEINSRIFGQICIDDSKVIHFVNGIVGFPQLTEFALIHDQEKEGGIQWLQSMQEPQFALPVMNPLDIMSSYNPQVEDELLKPLGSFENDDMLVLVTVTVPSDLTKMSVNLQGPIIINADTKINPDAIVVAAGCYVNADTKKACQIIAEGEGYDVKYPIYELLQSRKAGE